MLPRAVRHSGRRLVHCNDIGACEGMQLDGRALLLSLAQLSSPVSGHTSIRAGRDTCPPKRRRGFTRVSPEMAAIPNRARLDSRLFSRGPFSFP